MDGDGEELPQQRNETARVPIRLIYDGPGYDGEMPLDQLAVALSGLDDYLHALVTSRAFGDEAEAQPKVTAVSSGSFDINVLLELGAWIPGTLAVIGGGFAFYWKNMRRRMNDFEYLPSRDMYKVEFIDGEVDEWTPYQFRLYKSGVGRRGVRRMVQPLKEGAQTVRVITPGQSIEVPAIEADRFDDPAPDVPEAQHFVVTAVPDTVRFDLTKPWRLDSRTLGPFGATIEDKEFLRRVEAGTTLVGKHDVFTLQMRAELQGDERPRYYVEQVLNHDHGAEQPELPDAERPRRKRPHRELPGGDQA